MSRNEQPTPAQWELQQSVSTWVWGELLANATHVSEVINTPEWSEFDVTAPDGTRAVVRVEVKP